MPKTLTCPNCKYEIPVKEIEKNIDWADVIMFDNNEHELPCPECQQYYTVEIKAEPEIKIK